MSDHTRKTLKAARSFLFYIRETSQRLLSGHGFYINYDWVDGRIRLVPTKAEANRIALVMCLAQGIGAFGGRGSNAEQGALQRLARPTVFGFKCPRCTRLCAYPQSIEEGMDCSLRPWLFEGLKIRGEYLCLPCASAYVWETAMAYRTIITLQHEAEVARKAANPSAPEPRSKRAIFEAARDLTRTEAGIRPSLQGRSDQIRRTLAAGQQVGTFSSARARAIFGLILACRSCQRAGPDCDCTAECIPCGITTLAGAQVGRLTSVCTVCNGNRCCSCECRRCSRCNQVRPIVCGHGYCRNCFCQTCRGQWIGRLNRSIPDDSMPASPEWPRFLGFEIEVANCQGERAAVVDVLQSLGWGIAGDGSLPHTGIEIRSAPIRGDRVERDFATVFKALKAENVTTNPQCGLHIHVDARDLSSRQIVRCFVAWAQIEHAVIESMCPERKGNRYCQPLFSKDWQKIDPADFLEKKRLAASGGYDGFSMDTTGTKRKRILYASVGGDRYRTLNYQAYAAHKTLEFRLWAPRLDVSYILSCAKVSTAVIEFGKYGKFSSLTKVSAEGRVPSTRLTLPKLLRWFDNHIENRKNNVALAEAMPWQAGAKE